MSKKDKKAKAKAKAKASKKAKKATKPKGKVVSKSKPKPAKKAIKKVKVVAKKTAAKKIVSKKVNSKKVVATKPAKEIHIMKVAKTTPINHVETPKAETKKQAEANRVEILPKLDKPMEPRMPVVINKLTLMPIRQEGNLNAIKKAKKQDPNKTRYSDKELKEFKAIINAKLEESRKELAILQAQITNANDHGTDDTAGTFKVLEDGSDTLAKEEAGQMAARQRKFIEQLEAALGRIENKTYGICRVTGKLIPKERLRAVPHTTQSIEAKLNQYRD